MNQTPDKPAMRFLAFENDEEDAQTKAKLKEAAEKIEQAIARERSLNELIDYKPPDEESVVDLANDTRPLYERLLEQKNKKQEAFDDSNRLSNLVVKLDEDDANYLNDVARVKQEEEIKKRLEIYDALEEKKKMSEKRILEDERKMKEILIGSRTNDRGTTSAFKSKFSSLIKVKPKTKINSLESKTPHNLMDDRVSPNQTNPKTEPLTSAKNTDAHDSNRKNISSTHLDDEKEKSKQDYQREKKPCVGQSEEVMKCIGILPSLPIVPNPANSNEDQKQVDHGGKKACASRPKESMKCIGILPSMPLVEDPLRSSDESDDSADNLEIRIVPRVGKRKRR